MQAKAAPGGDSHDMIGYQKDAGKAPERIDVTDFLRCRCLHGNSFLVFAGWSGLQSWMIMPSVCRIFLTRIGCMVLDESPDHAGRLAFGLH